MTYQTIAAIEPRRQRRPSADEGSRMAKAPSGGSFRKLVTAIDVLEYFGMIFHRETAVSLSRFHTD